MVAIRYTFIALFGFFILIVNAFISINIMIGFIIQIIGSLLLLFGAFSLGEEIKKERVRDGKS